jgi:hypothetical protein
MKDRPLRALPMEARMLSFDETARFIRMQERLRACTFHEIRKDGHHKSSEGRMAISFCLPPVVGDRAAPYWKVEAYSYLLCPEGRSGEWEGASAAEAISKAEDAIGEWCFASEQELIFGVIEDEDEEAEPPDAAPIGGDIPF